MHRLGQIEDVVAWTFKFEDSFNERQIRNCTCETLPGALVNIDKTAYGPETTVGDDVDEIIYIGKYIYNRGGLTPLDRPDLPENHGVIQTPGSNR